MSKLKDFPTDFRKAREKKRLTQDEAAVKIRRTKRQVQNIENHGQIPGAEAFVLGCNRIIGTDPMDYMDSDNDEEAATT